MERKVARPGDLDAISETIALAFASDPVWAPALARRDGRTDHHQRYWHLFVAGAAQYSTVFVYDDGAAASVWLPPGGRELSPDLEAELEALLRDSLSDADRTAMHALYDRFDTSRAAVPAEHAYLSLLATHPDHRGQGVGQALLAADLLDWDGQGIPAYLESTNPANDHRYARVGFAQIGRFQAVKDDAPVTAMWRDVGGPGVTAARG